MSRSANSLPASASNFIINCGAVFLFFVLIFCLPTYIHGLTTLSLITLSMLISAALLWLYDFLVLRVHMRPSTELYAVAGKPDSQRLVLKLIGLYATGFIILLLYYFNPF